MKIRNLFHLLLAVMVMLCFSTNVLAQSRKLKTSADALVQFEKKQLTFSDTKFQNKYYLNVKFAQLPSARQLEELKANNIQLLSYHQNNIYTIVVPRKSNLKDLSKFGISELGKPTVEDKLSNTIKLNDIPEHAQRGNGQIEVSVIFQKTTSLETIENVLSGFDVSVTSEKILEDKTVDLQIAQNKIEELANHPLVEHIDVIHAPYESLNDMTRVIQGIHLLNSNLPNGYGLDGEGIVVGVGDDTGSQGHLDFDDRVIVDYGLGNNKDHGTHVGATIVGGGQINPSYQGIAPKAEILFQGTGDIISKTPDYWNEHEMVLTNNSYGPGGFGPSCTSTMGDYSATSRTIDIQLRTYPKVLHVYAAGNHGNYTCDSAYTVGYKTVLSDGQSAKNTLTVGNSRVPRILNIGSAKGPVLDGRLKPEVVAIGSFVYSAGKTNNYFMDSGTSMSSPAAVGTLALMNEAYQEAHGSIPDGALMKAIICNTAEDMGNLGPDFKHGFGMVNGPRAVDIIQAGDFYDGSISNTEEHTQTINVPAGKERLKILLYWPDVEAPANPTVALINDLDLEIIDPNGNPVLPWVLDHTATGVELPAIRAIDTLNNIEQVTIDTPIPGDYTIKVKGTEIPMGPQNYYVTYEQLEDDLKLVYPLGGESIDVGEKMRIAWEASPNNTRTFDIEFSENGGITWDTLVTNLPATDRSYRWDATSAASPSTMSKIRVLANGGTNLTVTHDTDFTIMAVPSNISFNPLCDGIIDMSWNGTADYYEVYYHDGSDMVLLDTTSQTTFRIAGSQFTNGSTYWFALKAKLINGLGSPRTVAKSTIPQFSGPCPFSNLLTLKEIYVEPLGRANTSMALTASEEVGIKIMNLGTDPMSNIDVYFQVNNGTIVSENIPATIASGDSLIYTFTGTGDLSQGGIYDFNAWLYHPQNTVYANDTLINGVQSEQMPNSPVTIPAGSPLVLYTGTGISGFLADTTIAIEGATHWDYYNTPGRAFLVNTSSYFQMYAFDFDSTQSYSNDVMVTIDLSQFDSNLGDLFLDFDYAGEYLGPLGVDAGDVPDTVWVRGDDVSPWLPLTTMDDNLGLYQYTNITDVNISDVIDAAGQTYGTSFQIRFGQTGNNHLNIDNVQLRQSNVLPIELVSFTAQKNEQDVILKWNTSSETNNDYFDIELANQDDVNNFVSIGRVEGSGTTSEPQSYQFIDVGSHSQGNRYYRLKQVDLDGSFSYSSIVVVQINEELDGQNGVFPNPFIHTLKMRYFSNKNQPITIQVIDTQGKIVHELKRNATIGNQEFSLDLKDKLSTGNYFVRILEDTSFGLHQINKLVK